MRKTSIQGPDAARVLELLEQESHPIQDPRSALAERLERQHLACVPWIAAANAAIKRLAHKAVDLDPLTATPRQILRAKWRSIWYPASYTRGLTRKAKRRLWRGYWRRIRTEAMQPGVTTT